MIDDGNRDSSKRRTSILSSIESDTTNLLHALSIVALVDLGLALTKERLASGQWERSETFSAKSVIRNLALDR